MIQATLHKIINGTKRVLPHLVIIGGILILSTSTVYAQASNNVLGDVPKLFGLNFFDLISQAIAQVIFQIQTIASWALVLAGMLLNFSINLTLHIKQFVDQTPAIFTTWKALRDIGGMFLIFFLLYAAIQYIVGYKSANFNNLIKNIVLAGVLINFSFFFAGLGIDASNMVSVQLYNAIAPKSSLNANNLSVSGINNTAVDGGLSDLFMSALKIPALYDVTGQRTTAGDVSGGSNELTKAWTQPFYIMLYGFTSIMIMMTAAFSFGVAAIMFIVRFVMLLFLLAFSPIWFISFISNDVKKYAGDWLGYYKNMLLIMPVYLLLMYMSLNVLTSQNFFGNPQQSTNAVTATTQSTGNVGLVDTVLAQNVSSNSRTETPYGKLIELAVNAVLVIFMMNIPLVGAISIGGKATSWLKADNLGAGAIWKKVGGYAGTSTLGRMGNYADKKLENTRLGNSVLGRDLRGATTGALASAKMGMSRSYADTAKLGKDVKKKQRELDNERAIKEAVSRADHQKIKELLGKMSNKEIESLDKDILTSEHVVPHISSSTYSNIEKGEKSDSDKTKIKGARIDSLNKAALAGDADKVRQIMKNMSGNDVAEVMGNIPAGARINDIFIENLKPSHLKDMENIDDTIRRQIGNSIHVWHLGTGRRNHPAFDYVDKNQSLWL